MMMMAAACMCEQGVRCVVHYQVPATVDVYVHRSGRTARANEDGLALALVTPREAPRYNALQQVRNRNNVTRAASGLPKAACPELVVTFYLYWPCVHL
jgi:superfamily II DNA/RNA helicase